MSVSCLSLCQEPLLVLVPRLLHKVALHVLSSVLKMLLTSFRNRMAQSDSVSAQQSISCKTTAKKLQPVSHHLFYSSLIYIKAG